MKDLAKNYRYSIVTRCEGDEYVRHTTSVMAVRNGRSYVTKMKPDELPSRYCDVSEYGACNRGLVDCSGVKDLFYTWVPENHFMKDSRLMVSYTGKIREFYEEFVWDDTVVTSSFPSYENGDYYIYGVDILKLLSHIRKHSPECDMSGVRKEFVRQCEWLKENEPYYAPHDYVDGKRVYPDDFGAWFDRTLDKYDEDILENID